MRRLPSYPAPLRLACLLLPVALAACGGSDGGDPLLPPPPSPAVSVTPTSGEIIPTQETRLTATVTNATNTSVSWSSSATGVATVDATGLVRGVAPGQATITATTAATPSASATATISVLDPCVAGVGAVTVPALGAVESYGGSLEPGDCVDEGTSALVDEWRFTLGSDAAPVFQVLSNDFSPRLEIELESGDVGASVESGTLALALPGGTYRLRVVDSDGGSAGAYELRVAQLDRCDMATGSLSGGQAASQAVTGIDCPLPSGLRADFWEFTLTQSSGVVFQLETEGWDGLLALTEASSKNPLEGSPIEVAQDGRGGPGAALGGELDPGTYRVWIVEEVGGERGAYSLSMETGGWARLRLGDPDAVTRATVGEGLLLDLVLDVVDGGGPSLELKTFSVMLDGPDGLYSGNRTDVDLGPGLSIGGSSAHGSDIVIESVSLPQPDAAGRVFTFKFPTIAEGDGPIRVRVTSATSGDGDDLLGRIVGVQADVEVAPVPESAILDLAVGGSLDLPTLAATQVAYLRISPPAGFAGSPAAVVVAEGTGAAQADGSSPSRVGLAGGDGWSPWSLDPVSIVFDVLSVTTEGSDIDTNVNLYLRQGALPTVADYACRSLRSASDEACIVSSADPAPWYAMIRPVGFKAAAGVRASAGATRVDGAPRLAWAVVGSDGSLQVARGAGGAPVRTTRVGTGVYLVELDSFHIDFGVRDVGAETVLANQRGIPGAGEVAVCGPRNWFPRDGATLGVYVLCADATGTPRDAGFQVVAVGAGAFEGPSALSWAPSGVVLRSFGSGEAYWWNRDGGEMTIREGDPDRRIGFGTSAPEGAGFFASVYGSDRAGRCAIASWSAVDGTHELACTDAAGATARWGATNLMLGKGARADGEAYGWAMVTDPSTSGTITGEFAYNASGGSVTVQDYGVGLTRVGFEGNAGVGAIAAFATILGTEGGKCHNEVSVEDSASGEAVVFVRCYDANDQPAVRPFSVLFLR